MPPPTPFCLHCEREPQATALRLCRRCAALTGVRRLYKKRRGDSPEWDEHLQRLVERAKKRLPLFPAGAEPTAPPCPRTLAKENVNRNARVLIRTMLEKCHEENFSPPSAPAAGTDPR